MFIAAIDDAKCDRSPGCPAARVCPRGAIVRDPATGGYSVDEDRCTGCGVCVRVCPMGAVTMVSALQPAGGGRR